MPALRNVSADLWADLWPQLAGKPRFDRCIAEPGPAMSHRLFGANWLNPGGKHCVTDGGSCVVGTITALGHASSTYGQNFRRNIVSADARVLGIAHETNPARAGGSGPGRLCRDNTAGRSARDRRRSRRCAGGRGAVAQHEGPRVANRAVLCNRDRSRSQAAGRQGDGHSARRADLGQRLRRRQCRSRGDGSACGAATRCRCGGPRCRWPDL